MWYGNPVYVHLILFSLVNIALSVIAVRTSTLNTSIFYDFCVPFLFHERLICYSWILCICTQDVDESICISLGFSRIHPPIICSHRLHCMRFVVTWNTIYNVIICTFVLISPFDRFIQCQLYIYIYIYYCLIGYEVGLVVATMSSLETADVMWQYKWILGMFDEIVRLMYFVGHFKHNYQMSSVLVSISALWLVVNICFWSNCSCSFHIFPVQMPGYFKIMYTLHCNLLG
jgi:hypothetical protein